MAKKKITTEPPFMDVDPPVETRLSCMRKWTWERAFKIWQEGHPGCDLEKIFAFDAEFLNVKVNGDLKQRAGT
jgi:hypothetical protein